jgi:hypothetical protein
MYAMKVRICVLAALLSPVPAVAQYQEWRRSGSIAILTTPEGANLPASATVEGFPLLVRLDKDWFDFTQAKVRTSTLCRGSPDATITLR